MTLISTLSAEATIFGYATNSASGGTTGAGVRGDRFAITNGAYAWSPLGNGVVIGPSGTTFVVGCAALFNSAGTNLIMQFVSSGSGVVFNVGRTSANAVTINNAAGTALATSATNPITINAFSYFEVKWSYSGGSATITLRVDGTVAVTWTGAMASIDNIIDVDFIGTKLMDFYLLNTSGSTNNDFLGDCRVEHLVAQSEGSSTGWSLGAGASKTAAVTTPTDVDASYIRTTAASTRQTFVMSDLASTVGTVKGVVVLARAHGETNGTTKVAGVVTVSSTTANSTSYGLASNLASSYTVANGTFETSPATSAAWTASEVNALEAGVVVLP